MPDRQHLRLRSRFSGAIGRNHALVVALAASLAGASLGAFVAMAWMRSEPSVRVSANSDDSSSPVRVDSSPVRDNAARVVETTGFASSDDPRSSPKCESQTWPYQSRDCLVRVAPRVRVVAPDRLDSATLRTIEGPAGATATREDRPSASSTLGANAGQTASNGRSELQPAGDAGRQALPVPKPAPLAKEEPARERTERVEGILKAAKTKRQQRRHGRERDRIEQARERYPGAIDEDGDHPPVFGRWSRRSYDVPVEDGEGHRRVYVIRRMPARDPVGGFIGGLFGGGWND